MLLLLVPVTWHALIGLRDDGYWWTCNGWGRLQELSWLTNDQERHQDVVQELVQVTGQETETKTKCKLITNLYLGRLDKRLVEDTVNLLYIYLYLLDLA